eukprot:TRINITY_DN13400_c0_g1_i1.p1 TRINITY_DN13400_c0_g1~~TRINITY_DN13400_c0_g1_i1.p1  ORF type:complete len:219 (+),score=27.48 TRINITY_DN13400_c0_g1_i1:171-827(+)
MDMEETGDHSGQLIAVTMAQTVGNWFRQGTQIVSEEVGEISETHDLINLMEVNLGVKSCALAYRIANKEKPIAIMNRSDFECYYQINGTVEIQGGEKLMIGKTLIKIVQKGNIWYIKITNPKIKPLITTKYELHTNTRYFIGRVLKDNEEYVLIAGDQEVSRRHCEMWFENGNWKVKDLESLNGTFVHLKKNEEVWLEWEQVFKLGTDLHVYFTNEKA